MDTLIAPATRDDGFVDVARILVVLQGAFLVVSAVEVTAWGLLSGTIAVLAPAALVTGASAVVTLVLAARLRARRRRARRLVMLGESFVLLLALVDLGLAIGLAARPLPLVALLTRVAIPVAVLWLLRRPAARAAFRPQGVVG